MTVTHTALHGEKARTLGPMAAGRHRGVGPRGNNGVGPTHAERLRAADIGTAANLAAESDLETVVDAADVSLDRAEKWIRQDRE